MSVCMCPRCKSLMIDNRCTNKSCLSHILDIDHVFIEKSILNSFKDPTVCNSAFCNINFNGQVALLNNNHCMERYGLLMIPDDWFLYFKNNGVNIDFKYLYDQGDACGLYALGIIKQVELNEVKKYINKAYRYFIKTTQIFGSGAKFITIFGSNDTKKWFVASNNRTYVNNKIAFDFAVLPIIRLGYVLLHDWNISMKSKKDGVWVNYMIDKDPAYEIFKNRELLEGKKRRTALRHCVEEYAKEDGRLIQAYLRCPEEFEWNGMMCKMIPPISLINKLNANKNKKVKEE